MLVTLGNHRVGRVPSEGETDGGKHLRGGISSYVYV